MIYVEVNWVTAVAAYIVPWVYFDIEIYNHLSLKTFKVIKMVAVCAEL